MDLINGLFESLASIFIFLSLRRVWKDKDVKGVSPIGVSFFAAWGFWNLIYYPSLGHWFSAAGAVVVATLNTIWCLALFKYGRQP